VVEYRYRFIVGLRQDAGVMAFEFGDADAALAENRVHNGLLFIKDIPNDILKDAKLNAFYIQVRSPSRPSRKSAKAW
jgi:hypothetical protein